MSYLGTLNSLLTSTTSRYASLRRNILSSSSEDDTNITDPSSTHVSRVLRAYYTEKALPFPPWLGPDPRDAARTAQNQTQPYVSTRPIGSLRGTSAMSTNSAGNGPPSRSGGLGDIWGDGPNDSAGAGEERGGLRRGVLGGGRRAVTQQPLDQGLNVRPLPSQRVGSYQTRDLGQGQGFGGLEQSEGRPPGSSGSAGGGTVQDRLKARLGRGGSGRNTPEFEGGGGGRYGDDGRGGGGGGQGDGKYDDTRGGRGEGGSYATQGLSGWQGRR